ncbi:Gfo/Idh/MocA family protein [Streptomonospora litoralis]|uniref:Oxidoreductase YteT n=1 Tax=Streptomonospora litoralis TaxID=2498135 RepID=A0A4P6Q033_9ACTN|nr:Gfo/Idh/MocA family oxidoreductase [Streptomonospora litoralis]QBI52159.1 Putative oxidoreductase YteT precursor [Streptomonospora litoralis]
MTENRRYAVVGTGARAQFFIAALAGEYADVAELAAWCEPNPARMDHADSLVAAHRPGARPPARYGPDDLERMIADERVDTVVVTSPDWTHADMVARAMRAGADVVLEKPLTTSVAGCRTISAAAAESGRSLVLTFNYRYSPRNAALKEVLASGAIGEITSVHFEWALDTMHGADYFRRWHRDKGRSAGLAVHKASHHFDLVNWWLADTPGWVFASGGLRFYGDENARARGLGERPERGTVDPPSTDPFALDLRDDAVLRSLYWDAEANDGYLRDRDVFSSGITIEDNVAALVGYGGGAVLTYSLNAHSPWEGYRVAVNGTAGRAELDVVERSAVLPGPDGRFVLDASSVADTADSDGRRRGSRLTVQRHWERARPVPIEEDDAGGHGGGDALLLQDVFGTPAPDPLGRRAEYRDGLASVAVGLAANASMDSGLPVRIAELGLPPLSAASAATDTPREGMHHVGDR